MGFNDGRPAPTNTFDWGSISLTTTQKLYTRMFTLNEANAYDTLRLCNAGMIDSDGTISSNKDKKRSGFSIGPVQFDLAVNDIGRDAFINIVKFATDASGNPIFSSNEKERLLDNKAYIYRDNNSSAEAIEGRQTMFDLRDKIDCALQSEYGEERLRQATLKQFSVLEKVTQQIINNNKDQSVRDYLSGSQFARALIADLVNQRGPTGASNDMTKLVKEMLSNSAKINDFELTNAAIKLGRADAKKRVFGIKKAISGQSIGPSSTSRNSYNFTSLPIDNKKLNNFAQSKSVPPPRRDPLVFDLDGDGIETVGTSAGVLDNVKYFSLL